MEAYQWIHPAVALSAILLFAATAWAKLGPKKYFRLHYGLAGATVTMMIATIGLGSVLAEEVRLVGGSGADITCSNPGGDPCP